MRTVFEGPVSVDYSQATVESDPSVVPDLAHARGGQVNGLCGAAVPGVLWLTTGPQYGQVWFTVELHDTEPPVGDGWEEVVEVSFTSATAEVHLLGWGGGSSDRLDVGPGDWRVRYCLTEMDDAPSRMPAPRGEPPLDRYLLQFWPAEPAPDRVVRQTSAAAADWHRVAAETAPPPPPPTPEEIRAAEEEEQRRRREARRRWEVEQHWSGRAPSERLRTVGGNVLFLAQRDRDLLDDLDSASPEVQREVAVWAARQACEAAGIATLDWVAAGLDALDRSARLPPPFDHPAAAFERLRGGRGGQARFVVSVQRMEPGEEPPRVDPRYAALPAIRAAAHEDPLRAAIDTIACAAAAYRSDAPALYAGVRTRLSRRTLSG